MKSRLWTGLAGAVAFVALTATANAAGKLFGAWAMDEGTGANTKDGSGNGFDGKITGAKWVAGKYGKALDFNGDGDFVLVAFNEKQNVKKISLAAWVKPNGFNPELSSIAQKWDDGGNKRQYLLTCYQGHEWFYVSDTGNNWPAAGKTNVPNGEWTHIVGTYDGKTILTYVNGQLSGEAAHGGDIFASDTPILIGGYGPTTPVKYGTNRHWKGAIDEVQFYDDVLTAAEVKDVMNTSIAQLLPVLPQGKLASVWSQIKTR